ncbi:TPA: hypothetical protein ACX6QF_000056 [Photobacterium damselae]|uniref:hypothetical protein n=1 Tax=Photobacterium damselae TaxID=38293 RepID=UPI001F35392B|nr:hypothetical protein [Photobacterium damselae]UKA08957.1 hypothetical protein IHC91_07900 [Photobacterium damselae subsp. damselae]
MGLEQQISSLVQASENLTGAVNNKIGEIDKKVNAATSSVPDKIKEQMTNKIYVDSVSGNDINSGKSLNEPKRNIYAAINSVPMGSSLIIILLGQQVYELNSDINCAGKLITIDSYGAVWGDPSTRSTIRSKQITTWGEYKSGQFITGFGSEIHLHQVNIETVLFEKVKPDYEDYRNSMFSGASSSSQVWFYGCKITLNNGPLTHQHPNGSFGKLDVYLNSVGILINQNPTITGGKAVVMGHWGADAVPFTLYVASTGLPTGKTWRDMVTANISSANSNVSFS